MQTEQQTLIFLSPGFAKDEADTSCLPLQQQLVKHVKDHYPHLHIVVITFHYPFKKVAYTWNGITIYPLNGKDSGRLRRLRTWSRAFNLLKRLREEHNIIGLYSFWLGECAMIGQRFAAKYHYRHFCWICGQDAREHNRYVKLSRITVGNLVALSDAVAENMVKNYGIYPANVIAGGLEPDLFNADEQERDIDLLSVGSLIPLKRQHIFLEIVARLRKHRPYIRAVICGDGPERRSLEEKVQQLHLGNNIIFTGQLPYSEVLKLMQQTRVLVHPSSYEGLGMVMLEALYAGAQVVSFVRSFHKLVDNWHVVDTSYHMAVKVNELLDEHYQHSYAHVVPYTMHDTARAILQLFDYNDPAIVRNLEAIALKESVEVKYSSTA